MFRQIWPPKPCMWRVFLYHDLIWGKNGFETHVTFSTHKQKFPSKTFHFRGTLYKICMLCVFRCADTILTCTVSDLKGTSRNQNSCFGNNGCHTIQENVIKFWGCVIYLYFPDSSTLAFQGFLSRVIGFAKCNSVSKLPHVPQVNTCFAKSVAALKDERRFLSFKSNGNIIEQECSYLKNSLKLYWFQNQNNYLR